MLERVRRYLPKRLVEFFLLEQAEKTVGGRAAEQQERIRLFTKASDRRHSAAESLSDEDLLACATLLDTEAAKLAMAAVLVAGGRTIDDAALGGEKLTTDFAAAVEAGETAPLHEFAEVRSYLADADPLAVDTLGPDEALVRRTRVGQITTALRARIEARSLREIRAARYTRLGILAAAILGLLVWGVVKIASPTNFALHRPVTASSRWPNQPPGSGPAGLDPGGLTDGTKSGSFGQCTREEVNPWAMVDLGRVRPIGRIVVFNRNDCCQDHLPAVLELSNDGSQFEEVGRRKEVFTESKPWSLALGGKSARYVRVRIDGPNAHVLSLSELEVYAK